MTGEHEHDRYRRMIDDIVLEDLPAPGWAQLRKHLQGCASCRARYDKAVLAERMLHGGPEAAHTPSQAELDRIAKAVLEREPRSAWQRMLQWFAPTQRWATGLAAVAAVLALIPVLSHLKSPKPAIDDGFQSRGGNQGPVELFSGHPQLKPTERVAGLRAFCLDGGKIQPLDPMVGPKGPVTPTCARSGLLKLAVSNPGRFGRVFLVGLDEQRELKWYAPKPHTPAEVASLESVPAPQPSETVEVPVGASVRLVVNHKPGPVRIFALFSDQPVKGSEVEAATRELGRAGTRAVEATTLPLHRPDVLQRSLLIDVQP